MPDANGALGVSLQCLNQSHGPQDDTYLSKDVPNGGHTMYTWRMLLPQMLAWMTPRLTSEAQAAGSGPPAGGAGR
jgi:hypothetical protein